LSGWKTALTKKLKGKPKNIDALVKKIQKAEKDKEASFLDPTYPHLLPSRDFKKAISFLKSLKKGT